MDDKKTIAQLNDDLLRRMYEAILTDGTVNEDQAKTLATLVGIQVMLGAPEPA